MGAGRHFVLQYVARPWRRLVSRWPVRKPNAAFAWWRQMTCWNVNLLGRVLVADRVNLGLGGASGQSHREQAEKRQSRHDMTHWLILKSVRGPSAHRMVRPKSLLHP